MLVVRLLKRMGEDVDETDVDAPDIGDRLIEKMEQMKKDGGDIGAILNDVPMEPPVYSIWPLPGRVPIIE